MVARVQRLSFSVLVVLTFLAATASIAHGAPASPPPPCQPAPCTCSPGPLVWNTVEDTGVKTFQDPHNVNASYKLEDILSRQFDTNSEWGGVWCNRIHGVAGFWWYSTWGPNCVSPYPSIATENSMVDSTDAVVYTPTFQAVITRCAKWAWSTTEDATDLHCYFGDISIAGLQNQVAAETYPYCL